MLVIVVDDDPLVAKAVGRCLSRQGHTFVLTHSGTEALSLLGTADLLITDVMMPEMGGQELVQRARSAHPNLAILVISSSEEEQAWAEQYEAYYVTKGEFGRDLPDVISAAIAMRNFAAE